MAAQTAIEEFHTRCENLTNIDDVATALYSAAALLGFSYASYFSPLHPSGAAEPLKFANYSAEFLRYYRRRRLDRVDQITRRGCRATAPFLWNDGDLRAAMTLKQKRALDEARDLFGLRTGYAVPLASSRHSRAACFFAAEHDDIAPDALKAAQWISVLAHEKVSLATRLAREDGPTPILSDREKTCLTLWAHGLEDNEIGKRLHIRVNTVRRHLELARKRLGVETRREAIVRALLAGQMRAF